MEQVQLQFSQILQNSIKEGGLVSWHHSFMFYSFVTVLLWKWYKHYTNTSQITELNIQLSSVTKSLPQELGVDIQIHNEDMSFYVKSK